MVSLVEKKENMHTITIQVTNWQKESLQGAKRKYGLNYSDLLRQAWNFYISFMSHVDLSMSLQKIEIETTIIKEKIKTTFIEENCNGNPNLRNYEKVDQIKMEEKYVPKIIERLDNPRGENGK